jgi:hypothetical protein
MSNFPQNNGSSRTFTVDHANNLINSVGKNGILFSYADNHLFPELYLQIAEKVRPDINHCNLSLLNLEWYVRQKQRNDPGFPPSGNNLDFSKISYENWSPVSCDIVTPDSLASRHPEALKTIRLTLPALRENNSNLLQYLVLFDIIKSNQWRRPLYFVKQYMDPALLGWLKPWLSDEGLVYRLVPDSTMQRNTQALIRNLDNLTITGFEDPSVFLDRESWSAAIQYYEMFLDAAEEKAQTKDFAGAGEILLKMKRVLPFSRLQPGEKILMRTTTLQGIIHSSKN